MSSRPKHPQDHALSAFSNQLEYRQIGGRDVSALYVDRLESRPQASPTLQLQQRLSMRNRAGTYLFSGHRGTGKTTELSRLKRELEDSGIVALYADMSEYLNLSDPQLPPADLVMAVLAGLSDAVRNDTRFGQDVLQESIWTRIKNLLSREVQVDAEANFSYKAPLSELSGVEAGINVEATLKDNPSFVRELRAFAERSSEFFKQAERFAAEVVGLIGERLGKPAVKVVLLVDSLERLTPPQGQEQQLFNSLRTAFDVHWQRLQFPTLSVVYSVPPYLEAVLPNIVNYYAGFFYLPHFKVLKRDADGKIVPAAEGLQQIHAVLDRRYENWRELIAPAVVDRLAFLSGGNLRMLFRMLRDLLTVIAILRTPLPWSEPEGELTKEVIADSQRSYQFLLPEQRSWLKRIADSSECQPQGEDQIPTLIRLFDLSLVLDYLNGQRWYQIMPIVEPYLHERSAGA